MLNLYLGHEENRNRLYREFVALARQDARCLLLVPEQFTVHAEKRLMELHPAGFGGNAEVVSFRRLARRALIHCGIAYDRRPDQAVRAVVMHRAFARVRDQLRFYAGARLGTGLVAQLLALDEELIHCAVAPDRLEQAAQELPTDQGAEKITELAYILSTYRALLDNLGGAESEQETAVKLLEKRMVFEGYHIFIDGFFSFSALEYALLRALVRDNDLTVALMCDDLTDREGGYGLFSDVKSTGKRLFTFAQQQDVPVEVTREPERTEMMVPELAFLRDNLFSPERTSFDGPCPQVRLHMAADVFAEAEHTALCIKELWRAGYQSEDIAVVFRDEEQYKGVLDSVFALHSIPVFADRRTELMIKPLTLFIRTALDIAGGEFLSEDVLTHIKTGLTPLDAFSLGRLQRYCNVWDPAPSRWFSDFTENPDGFSEAFSETAAARLEAINEDRRRVIEPIIMLKKQLCGRVGDMCQALYAYLERCGIARRLAAQTDDLDRLGQGALAQENDQTWETVMRALDAVHTGAGEEELAPADFAQLMLCALGAYDIGRIPTALDEVLVGPVPRVRTIGKKAVFVLGVNDGTFPQNIDDTGLLADADREGLAQVGIELEATADERVFRERFLVYYAFTMPSQRLFLSCRQISNEKSPETPSSFWHEVLRRLPQAGQSAGEVPAPPDDASAFSRLVEGQLRDRGLLKYFESRPDYAVRLSRARGAFEFGRHDVAHSARLEDRLSGEGLAVSPTRLESFNGCRFSHFCKYVLGLRPEKKAKVDSAEFGNFIHRMLEHVLGEYARANAVPIWQTERGQVYARMDELMGEYLARYLGGAEHKTARFRFLFSRMRTVLHLLIDALCDEFAQSAFKAVDFELSIGKNGQISPVEIEFDGGRLRVEGTVDRVDLLETQSGNYVRVVDYKTGQKQFSFNDLYNGYSTQMLLYLFSLLRNGGDRYGMVLRPAGVLYFPAREVLVSVRRGEDETEIAKQIHQERRQSGLLIRDRYILEQMEKDLAGRFINAKPAKDGDLAASGNQISERGFAELEKHVAGLLREVGEQLLSGDVTANPFKEGHNSCRYCDYAAVCGFEATGRPGRKYESFTNSELEQAIRGDEDEEK